MMKKMLNVDMLKLVASFMIVAIHVYPFTCFSQEVDYVITRVLFRIAVPFFLMVTGFFVLPSALQNQSKLTSYTKKILKLYFWCILLYLPINFYNGAFSGISFFAILKELFFEGTFYHLWYFPALILGIWITYFILKTFSFKISLIFTFLFYVIGIFGDSYYGLIQNTFFSSFYQILFQVFDYTRNGLFYVPIFLFLGYSFFLFPNKNSRYKNCILFFLFFLFMGVEGFVLYSYHIPRHTSMYFFLIPTSYFLFSLISFQEKTFYKLLRSMSTSIYIWHPIFIVLCHFVSKISIFSFLQNSFCCYLFVLTSTVFFSYILSLFKSKKVSK